MKKQFLLILAIGLINPVNGMNQIPSWHTKTSKFINGLCFAGYTALSFRKAYWESPWNSNDIKRRKNLPDASPELTNFAHFICKKADIADPEKITIKLDPELEKNSLVPGASAYSFGNGSITVGESFKNLFEKDGEADELSFIISHEARHIANKDSQKRFVFYSIPPFIAYGVIKVLEKNPPIQASILGFIFKNSLKILGLPMSLAATALGINYLESYIFEQRADRETAILLGSPGIKGGISFFEQAEKISPNTWKDSPHFHRIIESHPTNQERIDQLKKIEKELSDSKEELD